MYIFCMKSFYLFKKFRGFDEFSQIVQGWDLDFMQLDRGEFKADLLQTATPKSLISYSRFTRSFDQRGSAPPGMWTFALFSGRSSPIIWHEKAIPNSTMVIYRPGSEIDCVSRPGFEVYTVSYTEEHLNEICANLELPEVKKLSAEIDHFKCNLPDLSENRIKLHRIIESFKRNPAFDNDGHQDHFLEDALPEYILLTLSESIPTKLSVSGRRQQAIRKAKEYLSEYPQEPTTVNKLCRIAQVSERTLQYAFLEHYGVTPKTYLKNIRLHGVRKKLLQISGNRTKIDDLACDWGFLHMGQFAAYYKRLFGELPSETLRQVT